jgi:hypothetical protein
MWNTLTAVANNQFLPTEEFAAFALQNEDKYRIDNSNPKYPEVGNFYVDDLIKDFRAENVELCARTREEKVAALRAANLVNFGPRG